MKFDGVDVEADVRGGGRVRVGFNINGAVKQKNIVDCANPDDDDDFQ